MTSNLILFSVQCSVNIKLSPVTRVELILRVFIDPEPSDPPFMVINQCVRFGRTE